MLTLQSNFEAKLRLFFLTTFAAIFLLAGTSFFIFVSVTRTQTSVIEDHVERMVSSQEIQISFERMVAKSRLYILSGNAPLLEEFEAAQSQFSKNLEDHKRYITGTRDLALYADIAEPGQEYIKFMSQLLALRKDGLPAEKVSATLVEKAEMILKIRDGMQAVAHYEIQQFKEAEADARKTRSWGLMFQTSAGILCLLSGVLLYRLLSRTLHQKGKVDESLRVSKLELERSNRELEQVAYVASHDLRSPLKSIASWVDMIEYLVPKPRSSELDQAIGFIRSCASRATAMIEDVMQLARISVSAATTRVDLNQLVQRILTGMTAEIRDANARISCGNLPTVIGIAAHLDSLFKNLVQNALSYRDKTRVSEIQIGSTELADEYRFFVQDNGIGIGENDLERVFGMFVRLQSGKEHPTGTGMGLALCKKVVELNKGRIWVESLPGRGSKFLFTYPKDQGL